MKTKIYLFASLLLAVLCFACSDDNGGGVQTTAVTISLNYPDGINAKEGVKVTIRNTVTDASFDATTDANGGVVYQLPAGVYEASASESRPGDYEIYLYNGINSAITVTEGTPVSAKIDMTESKSSALLIKELYIGGCPDDAGGKGFAFDQSVILYNNSSKSIDLKEVAFAIVNPYNATENNKDYENEVLKYENENWIPAGMGLWYFPNSVVLEPGKQIVVVHTGAIDNTVTYSQSINYANADYYACYNPEMGWQNKLYYPAPSEVISTSHYLKGMAWGLGNAWVLSQLSPAYFIFHSTDGTALKDFVDSKDNEDNYGGSSFMNRKKVPVDWIIDGIEVFQSGKAGQKKRLTASVDAGYVNLTNKQGHTLYRNVDKDATEALAENAGKIVYNYSLGFDGSTDPSGIDAEASIKNGARIIYKDTNNSTNDFHERVKSSLRN